MTEMLTDQLADILGEFCPGPVEKQTYELLKSDGKDIILDDDLLLKGLLFIYNKNNK